MPEVVRNCGLCGERRTLLRSHLLPKALYRLCRSSEEENPNPTLIDDREVVQTSDQIVGHFLCHTCEDLFSRCGEDWVLPRLARDDGSFFLRELIAKGQPIFQSRNSTLYDLGKVCPEAVEPLLYFATSIFWRCARRRWRIRRRSLQSIDFGPYEPEIRDFLLQKAPFPTKVAMTIVVDDRDRPDVLFSLPTTSRSKGIINHKFQVPGVLFVAFVGKLIPDEARSSCLSPPAPHCISVRNLRQLTLRGFADLMRRAEQTRTTAT